MKLKTKNKEAFFLVIILVFAAITRTMFFVGFGLGDDSYYASTSKLFMENGFKQLSLEFGSNYRIGLWIPISLSFKLFGINEVSFVLFSLLSSLGLIVVSYLIGKELFNEKVGLIAAFIISIAPFDSVFASTMTIDIPTNFLLAVSFLCFIKGIKSSKKKSITYYLLSNLCIIWAYFIKFPSVSMIFVFILISLMNFKKIKRHLIFYIILSCLFLTSFLIDYLLSGDPLHYFHQEMKYGPKPSPFASIGSWYFKWMFTREMSFGILMFGYLFYVSVFSIAYCIIKKMKTSYYLLIWFFTIFACLEFLPMGLNPYMVAPRFFRYTHATFVPAVLISAMVLYSIWNSAVARFKKSSILIKALFSIFFVLLAYTSLLEANKLANLYKDSFSDSKQAAMFLSILQPKAIYTDNSMLDRFNFNTKYERVNQTFPSFNIGFQKNVIEEKNYSVLSNISDAYIVFGGSRAPDINPILVLNAKNFQVPSSWIMLKEIKKEVEIYRAESLKIYFIKVNQQK